MADENEKKATAGIPAWQQAKPESSEPEQEDQKRPETSEASETTVTSAAPAADKSELISRASSWLADPAISSASTEEKRNFLESKGLSASEVDVLLSKSSDKAATDKPASSQPSSEIPPIITYPEFLASPYANKKPPLITPQRMATALYAAGATGATIWGTNKFLVTPMVESLTSARHSLYETTQTALEALNSKLSTVVSKLPPSPKLASALLEEEYEDEDPTELFHHDMATQTSPPLSPIEPEQDAGNTLVSQATSLETIRTSLSNLSKSISPPNPSATTATSEALTQISDLNAYLDTLLYQSPYQSNSFGSKSRSYLLEKRDTADDEVARLKAEIRAFKGAMLSAKNFPAGQRPVTTRPGSFENRS